MEQTLILSTLSGGEGHSIINSNTARTNALPPRVPNVDVVRFPGPKQVDGVADDVEILGFRNGLNLGEELMNELNGPTEVQEERINTFVFLLSMCALI